MYFCCCSLSAHEHSSRKYTAHSTQLIAHGTQYTAHHTLFRFLMEEVHFVRTSRGPPLATQMTGVPAYMASNGTMPKCSLLEYIEAVIELVIKREVLLVRVRVRLKRVIRERVRNGINTYHSLCAVAYNFMHHAVIRIKESLSNRLILELEHFMCHDVRFRGSEGSMVK